MMRRNRVRRLRVFVVHPSPLLTDHAPHGDGLLAYGYLRGLAERGHDIHVAAQAVSIKAPLPPNLHVHPISGGGEMGPWRRLVYAYRVRRLYDRLAATARFDVIHQLNPVVVGLLAFLPSTVPIVIGPYPQRWPVAPGRHPVLSRCKDVARGSVQWLHQRRADAVVLFNPGAVTNLRIRRPGLPRRALPRLTVVPPGIDLDRFKPGGPAQPNGERTILFLTSLQPYKGLAVLLDAFEDVAAEVADVRLVVAGRGPLEDLVNERARRPGARGRIEAFGHVEHERVAEVMRTATIYCLPSFGEPFGMTALEAMACGRPVVVTDSGGLGELVTPGSGLKVPVGDAGALAGALIELLRLPPDELEAMGAEARRAACAYSWPESLNRLEAAYRAAVAGRRAVIRD